MLARLPRNHQFPKSITITPAIVQTEPPKTLAEARRRALKLYKDWYKEIPVMFYIYQIPIPSDVGRSQMREIFVKNSKLTDIAQIHNVVLKGQMELNEIRYRTKETCHVYKYLRTLDQARPNDFLSKFLESNNQ